VLSEEGHAAGDAWQLADRALALAERAWERMATHRRDPFLHQFADRALTLGLALFDRAQAVQDLADTHQEQER
jgi:hypothetical protein